jgi:hypothetical protein
MVGPFLVSVVAMVLLSLAVTAASVVAMALSLVVTAASVSVSLFEPYLGGAECAVRAQLLEGVAAAKAVTARLAPWVPVVSALAPPLLCGPRASTAPG